MKIHRQKVVHNQSLNYSQISYLRERYESLGRQIERKFGIEVTIEHSRLSEAAYFSFYDGDGEKMFELSIRNHRNRHSNADSLLWLSDFEKWEDVKKAAFNLVAAYQEGTYKTDYQKIMEMDVSF